MDKIINLGILGTVTEKEFWLMLPKVGECFQFNKTVYLKCTQCNSDGLRFTKIVMQSIENQNYKYIGIQENVLYPSLDFLNDKYRGKIYKISSKSFDKIFDTVNTALTELL